MTDKKLSETESLNYTTEVPVYVAVVKYSDNTEQAITENRKIPLSQFAKDSLVLHNTGNEEVYGYKQFHNHVKMKNDSLDNSVVQSDYHDQLLLFYDKNNVRIGSLGISKEANSTVNRSYITASKMINGSLKYSMISAYIDENGNKWCTLPEISFPHIKKQNSDLEGGEIYFESADNEVNAGKAMSIIRHNGQIRIVGRDSNDNIRIPFKADIQNDTTYITNARITNSCYLERNSVDVRFVAKDTGYAQGDTLSENRYTGMKMFDRNNVVIGSLYTELRTNGTAGTILYVKTPAAGATTTGVIGVFAKPDGIFYTSAPTPSTTNNSTNIATTAFVTNLLHYNAVMGGRVFDKLFSGPIGSGNITLSQPYTNYDALLIIGSNDSGNYIRSTILTAAELNLMRSYYKPWMLWINDNAYWSCTAESTTSSFITYKENSVIQAIYGIKY